MLRFNRSSFIVIAGLVKGEIHFGDKQEGDVTKLIDRRFVSPFNETNKRLNYRLGPTNDIHCDDADVYQSVCPLSLVAAPQREPPHVLFGIAQ